MKTPTFFTTFALILFLGFLFESSNSSVAGIVYPQPSQTGSSTTPLAVDSPPAQKVVTGNKEFAIDLYKKLKKPGNNLIFSPYSVSSALAMTYAGARGKTAKQMAQTLHLTLPSENLHPAFAELQAHLNAEQQKDGVKLSIANSLWPQKHYPFLPDYLALCQKYYDTSITPLDYKEHTEAARKTINDWVADKTNQKILDLIAPGMLDSTTRLVLVDAIYFNGKWAQPFDPQNTHVDNFHLSMEKIARVPMMGESGDFAYAEYPDFQIVALPYEGGHLSMVILLPRDVDGLANLETKLTTKNLTSWLADLKNREVIVVLPRFKTISEFSLGETLKALGMKDAFNYDLADFSGMDGKRHYLFIGAVIHKAFVKVGEKGTEAAAATAVGMGTGGGPPATASLFDADRPFLFLIRDNQTGSILFMGRVTDPSK